jgi:hypothetical protein
MTIHVDAIPIQPIGEHVSWRAWFNQLFLITSRGWVPVRSVSASATVSVTDNIVLVDATAGAVTLTLPGADKLQNKVVRFVKIDASANAMTIDGDGQNISGAGTQSTTTQYDRFTITGYGSLYYLL